MARDEDGQSPTASDRRDIAKTRRKFKALASYQYIYVMKNLTKVYPGGREVLKNITLAFLPGAKIGVLGYNGAGKSTLLRIMAGLDAEFNGEAWAADGSTRSEEHTSELQ